MGEEFDSSTPSTSPDNYIRFKAFLVGTLATIALTAWLLIWQFVVGIDVPGFDIGLVIIGFWTLFFLFVARRKIDFDAVLK